MLVALAVLGNRIAPLLDTSTRFLVLDLEAGLERQRRELEMAQVPPERMMAELAEMGVQVLVCGAVSRRLAGLASVFGIRLFPFVAGDVPQVVEHLLLRSAPGPELFMPGRGGRRRRRARRRGCAGRGRGGPRGRGSP